jgi:hypothetical protein
MRNSFNVWQAYQVKHRAKPRNKAGGAQRKDWSHKSKNAFKSVCFVRTSNDNNDFNPNPQ